jgi:hypothetical protein
MPRQVRLDLRGSPPVTGGLRDHVPPGTYRLKVTNVDETTSRSNKRMWVAAFKVANGDHIGSNLGDNFVLEDNNGGPSKMGIGRLHHFLLCLGLPVKEAVVNLDLDRLTDLECEADVVDEHFTDNSGNDRLTSAIRGYRPLRKDNGVSAAPPAAAAPAQPVAAAPEPEEAAEEATEVAEEIDDLFK